MSFSRYNTEDSVISAETVVRGLWSGDTNTLNYFATSSNFATIGGEYYLDVYDSAQTSIQFDIQFGHISGSGSAPINPQIPGYSPSRVVYGQYRNLVYGTEDTNFSFDGGQTVAKQIFAINISRDRYKQALQPGSFNLTVSNGGANIVRLTDDSNTTSLTRFIGENRVFYIISGSDGNYCTQCNSGSIYGMMLPDLGVIILDASGSMYDYYPLNSIYLAPATLNQSTPSYLNKVLYDGIRLGQNFKLKSAETISSRYFFTRIKNSEFNYTTNPSIIDNNGNLLYSTLINSPQTYITTVGMYNDNNELLAVAKLSKPLTKDFTKEALIRIKLDY